jgi:hypothetical protein
MVKLARTECILNSLILFRHISALKGLYGDQLLMNLLGSKEGESYLTRAYQVKTP